MPTIHDLSPLDTPTKFKTEKDMIVHFANNLHLLEPGLRLYTENGCTGIEVPCRITDWGRQGAMDILAVDANAALVVIECKRNYGDGASFGQLLGYLAWIKRKITTPLSANGSCRGEGLGEGQSNKEVPTIQPLSLGRGEGEGPNSEVPSIQPQSELPNFPTSELPSPPPAVRGFLICKRANPILRLLTSEYNSLSHHSGNPSPVTRNPSPPITIFEYDNALDLTRLSPSHP